jgi:hypothetical protein
MQSTHWQGAETRIAHALTSRPVLAWGAAVALYISISYPYQALILPWLDAYPQALYAFCCLAGILFLLLCSSRPAALEYRTPTAIALYALAATMLLTFAVSRNLTAIRELLLLVMIAVLVLRSRGQANIDVVRALIHLNVLILIPAILVVGLFYAEIIDWPTWRVERLGLASANPLMLRAERADFEYYLPLWLAVVPHIRDVADQGFGLTFIRQPLVFIEPTDTWLNTAGLFALAIADRQLAFRKLSLAVLAFALAISFSLAGVLAMFAGILFCVAAFGGRLLVLAALGAVLALLAMFPIDQLLLLVGSNKAEQLEFYSENVSILNTISLFGVNVPPDEQELVYGFLVVLQRYGIVGSVVAVAVLIVLGIACFRLLMDKAVLGWRRFPVFVAGIVSLVMLAKYPGIVPAMPLLCLATGLSLRQLRMDPLTRALLK